MVQVHSNFIAIIKFTVPDKIKGISNWAPKVRGGGENGDSNLIYTHISLVFLLTLQKQV